MHDNHEPTEMEIHKLLGYAFCDNTHASESREEIEPLRVINEYSDDKGEMLRKCQRKASVLFTIHSLIVDDDSEQYLRHVLQMRENSVRC